MLGVFYWMLENLHLKYRSSIKTLNLAILCPVKWIKKYMALNKFSNHIFQWGEIPHLKETLIYNMVLCTVA